jgi:hypothetical protein
VTDLLLSVDDTIDVLITIARKRGTAVVSVFPICMEVDVERGDRIEWYLDGDKATEVQVRAAWKNARAARAPKPVQSIARVQS